MSAIPVRTSAIPVSKTQASQSYFQRAQGCLQKTLSACSNRAPSIFKESLSGLHKGLVVGTGSAIAGILVDKMNPATAVVTLLGHILINRIRTDSEIEVNSSEERDQASRELFSPFSRALRLVKMSVGAATTISALGAANYIHPVASLLSPVVGYAVGKFTISNIVSFARHELNNNLILSTFASMGSTVGSCVAGLPGAVVGGAATGYLFELIANLNEPDDKGKG